MSRRYKIAVIGAGWAGLAAAAELSEYADVVLFEAGRSAGGRARSLNKSEHGFSFLDNGQHLLMAAYHSIFALLRKAGVDTNTSGIRMPLSWYMHDGMRFEAKRLIKPLHMIWGMVCAENLDWKHKMALLRQMHALQTWHANGLLTKTVADWISEQKIDSVLVRQFWQPLVWAVMNTPLEHADLRVLGNVLADGIWKRRKDSDFYVPNTDLNTWFVEPILNYIQNHGGLFVSGCRVATIDIGRTSTVEVAGQYFDAAVLSVAPYHLAELLPESLRVSVDEMLQTIHYHAITTVYLRYAELVKMPSLITGLVDGYAHWLIDRSRLNGANEIVAVISLSEQYGIAAADQWIQYIQSDVRRICPNAPEPVEVRVITEKRATVATKTGAIMPDLSLLRTQRLYVAGDYLHPHYPATLEAAVQSGIMAAKQCFKDLM